MRRSEASEQVVVLVDELIEQRRIVEEAHRRIVGLQTILRGYLEMFPDLSSTLDGVLDSDMAAVASGIPPRGADAVRRVLQAEPGNRFYVSEVVDRLRERGWLPDSDNPANAVRTALERLVASEDSDVRRARTGDRKVFYFYDPDLDRSPAPEPPSDYGSSDEEPF